MNLAQSGRAPGWMLLSGRLQRSPGGETCPDAPAQSQIAAPTLAPASENKRAPPRYEHIKGIVIVSGVHWSAEIPDSETFQSL